MNFYIKHIGKILVSLGLNPLSMLYSIRNLPRYLKDIIIFKIKDKDYKDFPFSFPLPQLADLYDNSGIMSGHYFHQDLLVAKKIFKNNPKKHIDIGSRTDGFVAHIASFREIEVFDIRKNEIKIDNIIFRQADLMKLQPNFIDYCDSISSLHAIEHFGLGRYGDPIDPKGHLKALKSIHKILRQGGRFYFSVPIGKQRIEFNGHRIFSIRYLLDLLKANYQIENFSYVDDSGNLHEDVVLNENNTNNNFNCRYGCGIFELIKK